MTKRSWLFLALAVTVALTAAVLALTPGGVALLGGGEREPVATAHSSTVNAPGSPGDHAVTDIPARGEVSIDSRRQQLIGVRVAPVRRTSLSPDVRAVGIVRFDETRQAEITTKVDGWIRDLRANYTGRTISQGEPLFMLYSPGLLAAQNEYLLALRGHATAATAQLPSVRDYAERLHQAAR